MSRVPSASTPQLWLALLDLRLELAAATHVMARSVDLNDCDLACLDIIHRSGPISPTELARRTATHAATMTGIIRRLEEGGWIERVAHPGDGRAVLLRVARERTDQLTELYADTSRRVAAVGRGRTPQERGVIAGYLRDVTCAVRETIEAR